MEKHKNEDIEYIEDVNPEEIYKYCKENIKVGDIVEGKIIEIARDGVYVDIGSKTDGFIPQEEFVYKDITKSLKPGEVIKVYISKLNYNNVHLVSFRKVKEVELMEWIEKCHKEQVPVDAKLLTLVDFGAMVDIGIDAVLPFREMTKEFKNKIKLSQDCKFKVLIKEIKQNKNNLELLVSQRQYVDLCQKQQKEKLFTEVKEGDIKIGTVKSVTDFGAFIDIDGVDALLHISDMAWYRVEKPSDIVQPGNKIKVKVLKLDPVTEKISVGMKQLFPHPWDEIENKYQIGEIVKCKVTNVTNFGVFAELEPAVEGLVHISEISWKEKNPPLNKMFKIGQEINAKVLEINKDDRRIALSIKKTLHNPWQEIKQNYPPGKRHKGKVTKIVPYGIFVLIQPGFEGLIHISDIYWTKEVRNLKDYCKIGDEIEYVILDILPDEERAILSIKHLSPNPYQKYSVGNIVSCKIKKILHSSIIVSLEDDIEGIIRKKDATIYEKDAPRTLSQLYKVGQELEAVVIYSDEISHKIELSIKKLDHEIQKRLIKKFSSIEAPKLKDVLEET